MCVSTALFGATLSCGGSPPRAVAATEADVAGGLTDDAVLAPLLAALAVGTAVAEIDDAVAVDDPVDVLARLDALPAPEPGTPGATRLALARVQTWIRMGAFATAADEAAAIAADGRPEALVALLALDSWLAERGAEVPWRVTDPPLTAVLEALTRVPEALVPGARRDLLLELLSERRYSDVLRVLPVGDSDDPETALLRALASLGAGDLDATETALRRAAEGPSPTDELARLALLFVARQRALGVRMIVYDSPYLHGEDARRIVRESLDATPPPRTPALALTDAELRVELWSAIQEHERARGAWAAIPTALRPLVGRARVAEMRAAIGLTDRARACATSSELDRDVATLTGYLASMPESGGPAVAGWVGGAASPFREIALAHAPLAGCWSLPCEEEPDAAAVVLGFLSAERLTRMAARALEERETFDALASTPPSASLLMARAWASDGGDAIPLVDSIRHNVSDALDELTDARSSLDYLLGFLPPPCPAAPEQEP